MRVLPTWERNSNSVCDSVCDDDRDIQNIEKQLYLEQKKNELLGLRKATLDIMRQSIGDENVIHNDKIMANNVTDESNYRDTTPDQLKGNKSLSQAVEEQMTNCDLFSRDICTPVYTDNTCN